MKAHSNYLSAILTKDEHVIYEGSTTMFAIAPHVIISIILIMLSEAFMMISAAIIIYAFFLICSVEIVITNKRLIAKFGIFKRKSYEINIDKIESFQINQGILGRVFNYGSLTALGTGSAMAPIPMISKPFEFKKQFSEIQELTKEERLAYRLEKRDDSSKTGNIYKDRPDNVGYTAWDKKNHK
ncbi:TPA: PH domain-containing protein [Serratia marcescens]|uniref:PH domain-containing protein n=1 Tax=Serratia marcescens TaxID=615 RepID=UPI001C413316|nr:PH domain-containing protein [Serratia marcescens]EGT0502889.1 PH domain-containing protein [Serratia marcescens]MDP8630532.1 PH domain-containing protein [Serratia marcescens]MDP8749364.1 PH domain-containing protein [Serratia marcescens]MDP8763663.1 PH domain-containing protein [Serratia marcescens]HBH7056224.1 PH domain-containing protein [Serratia marcescens]